MRRADEAYLPLTPTALHVKSTVTTLAPPSLLQTNQFSGFYDTTHQTTLQWRLLEDVLFLVVPLKSYEKTNSNKKCIDLNTTPSHVLDSTLIFPLNMK